MWSQNAGEGVGGQSSPGSSSDSNTLGSLSPPEPQDFVTDEELPMQCPVFCEGQGCEGQHHMLLQAILNCGDTSDAELMERRLNKLEESINKYKSNRFGLHHVIPDKVDRYKATLGHWACALGQVEAMKWLCEHGFNPLTKTKRQKETPLHFAIKALPETCPDCATRKLQTLLPYLGSTFLAINCNGNTPLHVCCSMLRDCQSHLAHYYLEFMAILLSYTREKYPAVLEQMLSSQNFDGDTPLHLVVEDDTRLGAVKMLVELGTDLQIKNNNGKRALDIASDCNQEDIVHYLCSKLISSHTSLTESPQNSSTVTTDPTNSSPDPHIDQVSDVLTEEDKFSEGSSFHLSEEMLDEKSLSSGDAPDIGSSQGQAPGYSPDDLQGHDPGQISEDSQCQAPGHSPDGLQGRDPEQSPEDSQCQDVEERILLPVTFEEGSDETSKESQDIKKRSEEEKIEVKKSKGYYSIEDTGTGIYRINLPEQFYSDEPYDGKDPMCTKVYTIQPGGEQKIMTGLNIESDSFPSFVKSCDTSVQEKIYGALIADREDSLQAIDIIETRHLDVNVRIEKMVEQQQHTSKCIHDLLERLDELKREEVNLRKAVDRTDEEIQHKMVLRHGLKERLRHCNAALNALASVSDESETQA